MADTNVDTLLARARSALNWPTLYWLGFGGWTGEGTTPTPRPGTPIDPAAALARLDLERPEVAARYREGLQQGGWTIASLPREACDCSGYVAWALGIPRRPWGAAGGWFNTDAIHADARSAQRRVQRIERAVPGALLVYPSHDGGKEVGHVAIVTEVSADGAALKILHCAPENYLLEPAPGAARNAIAETDAARFAEHADTLVVMALPRT